jgi:hypothetical protein
VPKFNVYVRQYVEELAEEEVEAENEAEARQLAEDGEIDFDWSDGDGSQDFEVIRITPITDETEDEDKDEEEEDEKE